MIGLMVTNVPDIAREFEDVMSGMNQREPYDPGIVYDFFFNFTETDPLNVNFERLGLESLNYIDLTGAMFIDILTLVLANLLYNVIQKICKRNYTNYWARYIGHKINVGEGSILKGIQIMFVTGFLDITICALLSVKMGSGDTIITYSDYTA
jgi:hypothetical protein